MHKKEMLQIIREIHIRLGKLRDDHKLNAHHFCRACIAQAQSFIHLLFNFIRDKVKD